MDRGGRALALGRESEIDRALFRICSPTSGATSFDLLASLTREFGLETELELPSSRDARHRFHLRSLRRLLAAKSDGVRVAFSCGGTRIMARRALPHARCQHAVGEPMESVGKQTLLDADGLPLDPRIAGVLRELLPRFRNRAWRDATWRSTAASPAAHSRPADSDTPDSLRAVSVRS